MRAILLMICAGLLATEAAAEDGEPHFDAFEVSQSPSPRAHAIARFEIGGAPMSLNAYGRKARAQILGETRESAAARQLAGAFDPAAKPAVVTFEARLSF